jgi:hypothetical protein
VRENGGTRQRTIVFEEAPIGAMPRRTYRLPTQLKKGAEIDGAELKVTDLAQALEILV